MRSTSALPASILMSKQATLAPHPTSAQTISPPRTPEPPVIATVFPLKSYIFVSSAKSNTHCPHSCLCSFAILHPLFKSRQINHIKKSKSTASPEKYRGDVPAVEVLSHVLRDNSFIGFEQAEIALSHLGHNLESYMQQLAQTWVVLHSSAHMAQG